MNKPFCPNLGLANEADSVSTALQDCADQLLEAYWLLWWADGFSRHWRWSLRLTRFTVKVRWPTTILNFGYRKQGILCKTTPERTNYAFCTYSYVQEERQTDRQADRQRDRQTDMRACRGQAGIITTIIYQLQMEKGICFAPISQCQPAAWPQAGSKPGAVFSPEEKHLATFGEERGERQGTIGGSNWYLRGSFQVPWVVEFCCIFSKFRLGSEMHQHQINTL